MLLASYILRPAMAPRAHGGLVWFGFLLVASSLACSRPAAEPNPPAAPAASPTAAAEGEPCFTSLVRKADGSGPAITRACAPGLVCDYQDARPDGPGRCKKAP